MHGTFGLGPTVASAEVTIRPKCESVDMSIYIDDIYGHVYVFCG